MLLLMRSQSKSRAMLDRTVEDQAAEERKRLEECILTKRSYGKMAVRVSQIIRFLLIPVPLSFKNLKARQLGPPATDVARPPVLLFHSFASTHTSINAGVRIPFRPSPPAGFGTRRRDKWAHDESVRLGLFMRPNQVPAAQLCLCKHKPAWRTTAGKPHPTMSVHLAQLLTFLLHRSPKFHSSSSSLPTMPFSPTLWTRSISFSPNAKTLMDAA